MAGFCSRWCVGTSVFVFVIDAVVFVCVDPNYIAIVVSVVADSLLSFFSFLLLLLLLCVAVVVKTAVAEFSSPQFFVGDRKLLNGFQHHTNNIISF